MDNINKGLEEEGKDKHDQETLEGIDEANEEAPEEESKEKENDADKDIEELKENSKRTQRRKKIQRRKMMRNRLVAQWKDQRNSQKDPKMRNHRTKNPHL